MSASPEKSPASCTQWPAATSSSRTAESDGPVSTAVVGITSTKSAGMTAREAAGLSRLASAAVILPETAPRPSERSRSHAFTLSESSST